MSFFSGSHWLPLPFRAIAIDITDAGDVYLLGENQGTYGNCLYKLDEHDTPQRVSQEAAISGLSFCTNGLYVHLISTDGRLNTYNLHTQSFDYGNKYAREADRGSDGSFYWIGSTEFTADNTLYKEAFDDDYGPYDQALPGQGEHLSIDKYGHPWLIDASLDIYRFRSDTPMAVDGKARDICVSLNDSVCIIGSDYST